MVRCIGSVGFATSGSPPWCRVSIAAGKPERSKKWGVMEGTPSVRHVVTQLEENAETKIRSGTNHSVTNDAMRTPRTIVFLSVQALVASSRFLTKATDP